MICEPTPGLQGRASRDGASGTARSGLGTGAAQSRAWHAGLKGRHCDSLGLQFARMRANAGPGNDMRTNTRPAGPRFT